MQVSHLGLFASRRPHPSSILFAPVRVWRVAGSLCLPLAPSRRMGLGKWWDWLLLPATAWCWCGGKTAETNRLAGNCEQMSMSNLYSRR